MWSYYGGKSKVVDYYPPPKHSKIIEPFAGSARYALKWFDRDVLLVDKFDMIVKIWNYLKQASEKDILDLPNMDNREVDRVNDYDICDEAKWLIGFSIGRGSPHPRNKPGKYNSWIDDKKRIAGNLFKIRHWEIIHGSYEDLENEEATWFIDPPYQFGGEHYKHGTKDLDFNKLAEWCKSRNGQVIVCENMKANWLDFKTMIQIQGASQTNTTEAIWSNHKTNYDAIQQTLQF